MIQQKNFNVSNKSATRSGNRVIPSDITLNRGGGQKSLASSQIGGGLEVSFNNSNVFEKGADSKRQDDKDEKASQCDGSARETADNNPFSPLLFSSSKKAYNINFLKEPLLEKRVSDNNRSHDLGSQNKY